MNKRANKMENPMVLNRNLLYSNCTHIQQRLLKHRRYDSKGENLLYLLAFYHYFVECEIRLVVKIGRLHVYRYQVVVFLVLDLQEPVVVVFMSYLICYLFADRDKSSEPITINATSSTIACSNLLFRPGYSNNSTRARLLSCRW